MVPGDNTERAIRKPGRQGGIRDVVLLHGWGSGVAIWHDLAAELAAWRPVHAPDLPGYGAAPACAPYTLDALAAELARNAPARCDVVGWSLGAQVALAWARRAPQQVVRLALIAATPCFAQRADWPHAVTAEALAGFSKEIATGHASALRRFTSLEAQGDEKAKQVARQLRAARTARNGPDSATLAAGLHILAETDLRGALASIAQPVLVLHGDRDRLAPLAAGEYLSSRLINARLCVLRGAAHAPFLSRPQETFAALMEFLDG
jgi:pimeloyl-[acyl-carrier protein] methyl ester esterase